MPRFMNETQAHRHQRGAALVVCLLLLVVITVLAVSGMNTAVTELAMARNDQARENAFQAAETGVEASLVQDTWSTAADVVIGPLVISGTTDSYTATISPEGSTPALSGDRAFSIGPRSGMREYHFSTTAQGTSKMAAVGSNPRDAATTHIQGFYVIGPEDPSAF